MVAMRGTLTALKGCQTWGHTYEEALANAREAIDLYVQDLIESGEPVPVDQGTIELPEPAVVVNVRPACRAGSPRATLSMHSKLMDLFFSACVAAIAFSNIPMDAASLSPSMRSAIPFRSERCAR
jgi:predicted RNase H-like HicB family nuclease